MRRRKLYQPARSPRRWGRAFAVSATALVGGGILALGLPSELMGSAPRTQDWATPNAQIRIVDGDTLRLGDRMLRLYGVEAPQRGQFCTDPQGRLYDCGTAAAAELARLVGEKSVDCRVAGRDRFGRALGACRAGDLDLNAAMVTTGWALADGGAVPALAPLEVAARQAQRGLWAGGFEPPAHWRRGY
ncbi:thermonuclease family protein [Sediminicoccus sp. KRV36]|uniref:thermonuclease family protein n=1 Tax=Sediminicoccus sp. KRV36 TaxID=3133721 RepID=UPI00200F8F42|nr:thermonuclease family protein [Sediminicoccus rosea]UPY34943.1 thermonuclease family protein [Sediminicoccus rosea]